eukprot:m.236157 g.236157  ORF g.236157 m.236157 type:complete len:983 (+) comp40131_c0_seq11:1257-4205(+)
MKTQPTYKFKKRKCVSTCPYGYYGNRVTRTCEKEPGQIDCPDVKVINNENDAIQFENCTHVKGSLVISAYGGDERTLETYLQQIIEVSDYIMVFQTRHVTSLNFLKNLKLINGTRPWKNKYSLVLYDNADLSHLNFSTVNVSGSAYVYLNPRLCATNLSTIKDAYGSSKVESSGNSMNGLCNTTSLNVSFSTETTSGFTVHWSVSENRSYDVFGYLVKYRKPHKSVIGHGTTGAWLMVQVDPENRSASIGSLDSGTLYEVQVESCRIALEDDADPQRGQISDVESVKTTSVLLPLEWRYARHPCKPNYEASLEFDDKNDYGQSNKHYYVHVYEINWIDGDWNSESELHDNTTFIDNGTAGDEREKSAYCCRALGGEDLKKDKYYKYYSEFLKRQVTNASCECLGDSDIFKLSRLSTTKSVGSRVKFGDPDENVNETFVVMDIKPSSVYFVSVKTMVDGNCSPWTNPVFFWTSPTCEYDQGYMYAVTKIEFELVERNTSATTITVTWMKPTGREKEVLGYTVEFSLEVDSESTMYNLTTIEVPCEKQGMHMTVMVIGVYNVTADKTNVTATLQGLQPSTDKLSVTVFTNISFKYKPCYRRCYRCWPKKYKRLPLTTDDLATDSTANERMHAGLGGGLSSLALVAFVVVIFAIKTRKWRKDKAMFDSLRGYLGELDIDLSSLPCSPGGAYEEDEWEVDRVDVTFGDQLGEGAFGLVHSGTLIKEGTSLQVAIKSVLETCDGIQKLHFLREASFMKKFVCDYVVCLLGIVSRGNPPLVIMELMSNGDLKNYLRSKRPGNETSNEISFFSDHFPFAHEEVFQLAAQIATGMAYLSSKNFVHRDLAARNCMVTKDGTVKIGDFGMTRDVYQNDYYRKRGSGPMPVRWMAPESLLDGVFTSASDVWSYGVVLWEISTLGALPYPGLTNEDVILHVSKGKVLEVKELKHIPDLLVSVMRKCWRYQILDRPSYTDILKELPALEGYEAVV